MRVGEVMTEAPVSCFPDTGLREVARMMAEHNCGAVPVLDDAGVVGIVSDRDITCRAVAAGRNPVDLRARDVMSTPAIAVNQRDLADRALGLMIEHRVRHLPVLGDSGQLIGIISRRDLQLESSRLATV